MISETYDSQTIANDYVNHMRSIIRVSLMAQEKQGSVQNSDMAI